MDDAYRLKYQSLEQLRDIQEAWNVGILLIGDPGFEKSLSRMWHFCVRIIYAEEFNALTEQEVGLYIDKQVELMKLPKPTTEVYGLVYFYTQGNLRSLGNLFMTIQRVLRINDDIVHEITREVVETAREMMLNGLNSTLAKTS